MRLWNNWRVLKLRIRVANWFLPPLYRLYAPYVPRSYVTLADLKRLLPATVRIKIEDPGTIELLKEGGFFDEDA